MTYIANIEIAAVRVNIPVVAHKNAKIDVLRNGDTIAGISLNDEMGLGTVMANGSLDRAPL